MRIRLLAVPAVFALVAIALVGCSSPSPAQTPTVSARSTPSSSPASQTPTPTPPPSPTPTSTPAPDPLARLSLEQEVGQLFVVGTPAAALGSDALSAVRDRHVGGIFLSGRSTGGAAPVVATVRAAEAASADGIPLIVSTDQEGGEVQVLQGDGFDRIPSAVQQGTMSPKQLRSSATTWGQQLHAAGVNLDLAPVADIVPPGAEEQNPPIGELEREYGGDAKTVAQHAGAFAAGLRSAGVYSTAKHFPGLGYVTQNTDTHSGVTDTVVNGTSPDIGVYRQLISGGLGAVMLSSAIYAKIDPSQPGCFSPKVVGILRDQLDFGGIIMTDDMSGATQVQSVAPGDRAIRAIRAGVDVVLVSARPSVAPAMVDAVLAKAKADSAFRAQVDAAARRVLAWKAADLPG